MFGKTPVTALEEFCAKVIVFGEEADGVGRSKKEAKHDAAANMNKRLKLTYPDIEEIPQAPHETISTSDAIAALRDLCIQNDHPLPFFDIVQQTGPPEAPEFTAECSIASIKRYGVASTKKAAKQKAAQQIIDIIRSFNIDEGEKQIALQDAIYTEEEKNKNRIKTYREFVDSDIKIRPGTLLTDRHNFFKNKDDDIKLEVKKVFNDPHIYSESDRVHLLLQKLDIKYKISEMPAVSSENFVFVELLCDFDCCFADKKDKIWSHMLDYFKDMIQ
ncbi:RISC-loading complex subunit tarbp2 isoform X2 [Condylostylus longicornis]|uniref:RISC-loading complex subunit tarbp2 isoform X2 n=1 Tax=Condylostylus longicornis TaxID=2530218 RepID=UPI00244DBDB4|nr:RISC-loading complex subunit tarbp2 isoform X2 [Condylostylus longicornis]